MRYVFIGDVHLRPDERNEDRRKAVSNSSWAERTGAPRRGVPSARRSASSCSAI